MFNARNWYKKRVVSDAAAANPQSYELDAPLEDAIGRLREALGDDVIVREEEDGLGRFAGERPIMLVGRRGESVKLLRGSWGDLKSRTEEPMVEVKLSESEGKTRVEVHRVEKAGAEPSPAVRIAGEFVSTAILIAAAIYAFNTWRGLAIDYTKMAMVVGGATTLYVVAKQFLGEEENLTPTEWLLARTRRAFDADATIHDPGEA